MIIVWSYKPRVEPHPSVHLQPESSPCFQANCRGGGCQAILVQKVFTLYYCIELCPTGEPTSLARCNRCGAKYNLNEYLEAKMRVSNASHQAEVTRARRLFERMRREMDENSEEERLVSNEHQAACSSNDEIDRSEALREVERRRLLFSGQQQTVLGPRNEERSHGPIPTLHETSHIPSATAVQQEDGGDTLPEAIAKLV